MSASGTRLGLVLGSGGIKCAASVGLWRVMAREGIRPDLVVGCSGGSLFASCIAVGHDPDTLEDNTVNMWKRGLTGRPRIRSFFEAVMPKAFGFGERFGLLDDSGALATFIEIFGERAIDDTDIPLFLTATDMTNGEKVVIEKGRIADGIRASIAIPVVLPPWRVDGRLLIDGGASDPLPISVAIRENCDVIVAMGFENSYRDEIASLPNLISQTTMITVNHLLHSVYSFYAMVHHAEVIPIMPAFDRPLPVTDTSNLPYIFERGEEAAEEQIPYLKRLLGETGDAAAAEAAPATT